MGVFLGMSGIPISYSPGTLDQWPKNLSSHLMYGRVVDDSVSRYRPNRLADHHGCQSVRRRKDR